MAPETATVPGHPACTVQPVDLPNRHERRAMARRSRTGFLRIPSPVVQCPRCGSHARVPLSTVFRCCP